MTKTTRARIASGVRAYWKTVHAVQSKTGLPTAAARAVASSLRRDGYTSARTLTPAKTRSRLRSERARRQPTERPRRFTLTREREIRQRAGAFVGAEFAEGGGGGGGGMPAPSEEGPITGLDEFFEAYDDADYYDEYDVETSPDYGED